MTAQEPARRPRLQDVAAEAGVSTATVSLVLRGAAGPSGNRYGDAAGHTCLAVSGPAERVRTLETGSADRAANMQAFATAALALLDEALAAA